MEVFSLLPPSMARLTVRSEDELVFFGAGTIRSLIVKWDDWIEGYQCSTKKVSDKWGVLLGKSPSQIKNMARQHLTPTLTDADRKFYNPKNSDGKHSSGITQLHMGATTLNICGWCQFADGGPNLRDCNISTTCGIADNLGDRSFDSPCFVQKASDNKLKAISRYVSDKLAVYDMELIGMLEKVARLSQLEKRASEKPVLPRCRLQGWFKRGDRVVCYIGEPKKRRFNSDYFATGQVVRLERDGSIVNVKYHATTTTRHRSARPEMLHSWEFNYLLDNPTFAMAWVGEATKDEDLDGSVLLGALRATSIRGIQ